MKLLYYHLICVCSRFLLFLVRVYGNASPELFFTLSAAFFTYKTKKMNHQMKLVDDDICNFLRQSTLLHSPSWCIE